MPKLQEAVEVLEAAEELIKVIKKTYPGHSTAQIKFTCECAVFLSLDAEPDKG